MLAVGGGLLVAAGMFFLLGELDGYDQRMVGLAISTTFLVLGVAITTINRSTRAASAGVAISALAVIPMVVFLWANADVFGQLSEGDVGANPWDGVRGVVTLMLGTSAVVWLAGYLLGPGRRYGFYLSAAMLALWLIPMFHIQISAVQGTFTAFETSSTFETGPLDPGLDPSFDDPSFDEFDSPFDEPSFDEFDSQFDDDFTTGFEFEEPELTDPTTRLGVVSLAFGAVYLALAAWRDRTGDVRMATAALVPAIITLFSGTSLLTGHVGWVGWGVLAIVVGGALLAVGLRGGRRASSWIGLAIATFGLGSLVVEGLDESPRAIGAVLTVLGVVIALAVGRTQARPSGETGETSGAPLAPPAPPSSDPLAPPVAAAPAGSPFAAPPVGAAPFDPPAPSPPASPDPSPWGRTF
jgi:hypothetical protein